MDSEAIADRLDTSQHFTVLSSEELASKALSGDSARAIMALEWPIRVKFSWWDWRSNEIILEFTQPMKAVDAESLTDRI
jgi:hypothetical protein